MVRLRSRVGEVEARPDGLGRGRRGVVCLPHGYGHDRDGAQLSIAAAHAGVSVNDVNDEQRIDALTGTAAFSGTPVTVEPAPASRSARGSA